jgi:hypothetical protein
MTAAHAAVPGPPAHGGGLGTPPAAPPAPSRHARPASIVSTPTITSGSWRTPGRAPDRSRAPEAAGGSAWVVGDVAGDLGTLGAGPRHHPHGGAGGLLACAAAPSACTPARRRSPARRRWRRSTYQGSNSGYKSRRAADACPAHGGAPLHAVPHGTPLAHHRCGPMTAEPKEAKPELYAMPVHEVIAILKSSSDDRATLAADRRQRHPRRRRILAERAPEPDLVVLVPGR